MDNTTNKNPVNFDPVSRLVNLPVKPENVFHLPNGLPAFAEVKDFVFLSHPDMAPFIFMQALQPRDLTFVCVDPFVVCPGYRPKLSDADVSFLQLEQPEEAMVYAIVTVTRDVRRITANLRAPMVLNIRTCVGAQILCEDQDYPVQFSLWEASIRLRQAGQESGISQETGNDVVSAVRAGLVATGV